MLPLPDGLAEGCRPLLWKVRCQTSHLAQQWPSSSYADWTGPWREPPTTKPIRSARSAWTDSAQPVIGEKHLLLRLFAPSYLRFFVIEFLK